MRAYLPRTLLLVVVFGACALGSGGSTHAALGTADPPATSTLFLPMVRTAPSVPTVVFTTLADPQPSDQPGIPTESYYDVSLFSVPEHQMQKVLTQQLGLDLSWSGDGAYFLSIRHIVQIASTSVYTLSSALSTDWQPGGHRLLYMTFDVDTFINRAFLSNADGSGVIQLLPQLPQVMFAQWSPDGTKILAGVRVGDSYYADCYLLDADGSMIKKIATIPSPYPRWTPDSSKIFYFVPDVNNIERLWVLPVNGGDAKQISPPDVTYSIDSSYAWSPDARYVAYHDDQNILWITDADGVVLYHSKVHYNGRLQWSPDSSKLAYVTTYYSSIGTDSILWLVNVGSASPQQLAAHSENLDRLYSVYGPLVIWTDDSSTLVYRGTTSNTLFAVPAAGGVAPTAVAQSVTLFIGKGADGRLLFSRQVGDRYTITRSRVDGSEAEDLAVLDKRIWEASITP